MNSTIESRRFVVDLFQDEDGLWYGIDHGELRSPFRDAGERADDISSTIASIGREAEAAGGFLRRASSDSWVATVPSGTRLTAPGQVVTTRYAA